MKKINLSAVLIISFFFILAPLVVVAQPQEFFFDGGGGAPNPSYEERCLYNYPNGETYDICQTGTGGSGPSGGGVTTDTAGNQTNTSGNQTNTTGNQNDTYGNQTNTSGNQTNTTGNQNDTYGNQTNTSGNQNIPDGDIDDRATEPGGSITDCDPETSICNPLKYNSLTELIEAIITRIVIPIGAIVVSMALIWSGFLFVTAQGSEQKLSKAKAVFTYTVIGAAILLGAWAIVEVITGTICQIAPNTPGICG